jgi:hypothetical protein
MVNLGTITPMNFDGYLILSLSKDWINQFSGIPKFSVMINKSGKLCLISIDSVTKGEKFA